MKAAIRQVAEYTLWPLLFTGALSIVFLGFHLGREVIFLVIAYFTLAITLYLLENVLPYRDEWRKSDGQVIPDLAHTALTKGFGQLLLYIVAITGIAAAISEFEGAQFWPHDIHIFWQVLIALAISEFGLYWAHRLSHTYDLLWRFHSLHHSVEKLWFFNTGRFHFVDTFFSILLSLPLMLLMGAPGNVVIWVSSITVFIGFLTHCNINMKCGYISYVFNTPNVHRWHHSRKISEGNNNFGENLMLYDHLFRTFYHPKGREVVRIGIRDFIPEKFAHQLITPFMWKKAQSEKPFPEMQRFNKPKNTVQKIEK